MPKFEFPKTSKFWFKIRNFTLRFAEPVEWNLNHIQITFAYRCGKLFGGIVAYGEELWTPKFGEELWRGSLDAKVWEDFEVRVPGRCVLIWPKPIWKWSTLYSEMSKMFHFCQWWCNSVQIRRLSYEILAANSRLMLWLWCSHYEIMVDTLVLLVLLVVTELAIEPNYNRELNGK